MTSVEMHIWLFFLSCNFLVGIAFACKIIWNKKKTFPLNLLSFWPKWANSKCDYEYDRSNVFSVYMCIVAHLNAKISKQKKVPLFIWINGYHWGDFWMFVTFIFYLSSSWMHFLNDKLAAIKVNGE